MSIEITFVRHAETESNAAGVWQGTSDAPLTQLGRDQLRRLQARFERVPFDMVLTSDLGRARETAQGLGPVEVDGRWRELHLGSWEGLTRDEIAVRDPEAVAALGSGEDIAFGGGERTSEMMARLTLGLADLATRLHDGDRALVVSHGGALLTLLSSMFGVDTKGKLLGLTNTSVSTVLLDGGEPRVSVFNDTTHLPGDPVRGEPGSTHVVLARHGQTVANLEGRWQGQTGGTLTEEGREQARLLGKRFPAVDALFSSPLDRALDTARLIAAGIGIDPQPVADLQELGFGRWEMMTAAEVMAIDPEDYKEIGTGSDIVRGGTGETFSGLQDRISAAIAELADRHRTRTIGVVSHGAATRAFVVGILGLEFADRQRLGLLGNTAMGRVLYGSRGPALASWNLTPHLGD